MKILLLITASLFTLYALVSLLMYWKQEAFIFPDSQLPDDFDFQLVSPLPFEEVWLENGDAKINALFFPVKDPKGVVLYFHGNGGTIAEWSGVVPLFTSKGFAVFLPDYRGYGKSSGKRQQDAMYQDAQIAYDYLKERFPASKIHLYGRSLGSGFAIYLAAENTPQSLVLETPYTSLQAVAKGYFPILYAKPFLKFPMRSDLLIPRVTCPIFIVHGTEDRVIPHKHSAQLFEMIPHDHKIYLEIPGGSHNDLESYPDYHDFLDNIFGLQ